MNDQAIFILSILGMLAVLVVTLYYALKIYENWYKIFKPRDVKAEFMADCYKMQQKYANKGQTEFCDAISVIIRGFNLPKETPLAATDYGRTVQQALRDND